MRGIGEGGGWSETEAVGKHSERHRREEQKIVTSKTSRLGELQPRITAVGRGRRPHHIEHRFCRVQMTIQYNAIAGSRVKNSKSIWN